MRGEREKKREPNETTKEEEPMRRNKNNRKLEVIFVPSIFCLEVGSLGSV